MTALKTVKKLTSCLKGPEMHFDETLNTQGIQNVQVFKMFNLTQQTKQSQGKKNSHPNTDKKKI